MPQEPDKRIEELLKAYAKKRREDGGAPLEMHPATRKLLQAEVARLRPKRASDSASWFQSLIQFWPRVGFAASIVIALAVVIWKLGLENRRSAEFAQAARRPAMEVSSRDETLEKDVALKQEALDEFSARERNAKPAARAEKVVEESRSVRRPGEAPAINEMLLAESDAGKRLEQQMKLKEAAGAKSDQPTAPREQRANGSSPSSPLPVTQRQKNAPGLDGAAPIQPIEVARNPTGGVQAGGAGGAAAQSRLSESQTVTDLASQDLKAQLADRLALLRAPNVTTNAVVAYSINGTTTLEGIYSYSLQDSSGFSNVVFGNLGNYSTVFQNSVPSDFSTNLQLFADSRANVPALSFRQDQDAAWNEPSTLNKKIATIRAADPANLNLAKSEQRVKQELEAFKTPSPTISVDKDPDGLARRGQSTSGQAIAAWYFVAEPLQSVQAGQEVENVAPSPEQPAERTRSYRGVTNSGAPGGPLAASTVLNSFQMDLNGDRIRLIDADGSVYEGKLAAPTAAGTRNAGEVKAVSEATRSLDDAEKRRETLERKQTAPGYDAEPGPASFRVTGTNRSLNQLVVMDAVLRGPSQSQDKAALGEVAVRLRAVDSVSAPAPAPTVPPAPTTPTPTSAVAAQKPAATRAAVRQSVISPATKIQGKARIGATNEISINAIRVTP